MARTIMISNEVYDKLTRVKGRRSYSETIKDYIEPERKKTLGKLMKHWGALEGDTEYDEVLKESRKMFTKWTKRYA